MSTCNMKGTLSHLMLQVQQPGQLPYTVVSPLHPIWMLPPSALLLGNSGSYAGFSPISPDLCLFLALYTA